MHRFVHTLWHICFFPLLLWVVGFVWFVTLIPFSSIDDHLHTDAIVVLTGAQGRIERGLELFADDRADYLLISGVENGVTLQTLLHQKDNHALAEHIAQDHVTLGYKAHNTEGNAQETAQWIAQNHIHSIRLITTNIHMPRSLYVLSVTAPNVHIITEPVFIHHPERPLLEQAFDTLRLMVLEYHKSIAAVAHHTFQQLPGLGHASAPSACEGCP